MYVPLLIIVFVATITSAQYTTPVCPIVEKPWCAVRCNVDVEEPICVLTSGCKGIPITLRNMCVMSGYNCKCRSSPLTLLHEGVC